MTKRNFFIFITAILASCTNTDKTDKVAKEANNGGLYLEYKIWGEEGKENAVALFQFHAQKGGRKTFLLEEPSQIALDGEVLQPDSAGITGVFYELQKPVSSFTGDHVVTFTDANKKQFSEKFSFVPFTVNVAEGDVLSRAGAVLQLNGVKPSDKVRVVITDTSLHGQGINEVRAVKDGRMELSQKLLSSLKSGPVILQLSKEEERPIENAPGKGGQIAITYTLTRVLELQ